MIVINRLLERRRNLRNTLLVSCDTDRLVVEGLGVGEGLGGEDADV